MEEGGKKVRVHVLYQMSALFLGTRCTVLGDVVYKNYLQQKRRGGGEVSAAAQNVRGVFFFSCFFLPIPLLKGDYVKPERLMYILPTFLCLSVCFFFFFFCFLSECTGHAPRYARCDGYLLFFLSVS